MAQELARIWQKKPGNSANLDARMVPGSGVDFTLRVDETMKRTVKQFQLSGEKYFQKKLAEKQKMLLTCCNKKQK